MKHGFAAENRVACHIGIDSTGGGEYPEGRRAAQLELEPAPYGVREPPASAVARMHPIHTRPCLRHGHASRARAESRQVYGHPDVAGPGRRLAGLEPATRAQGSTSTIGTSKAPFPSRMD